MYFSSLVCFVPQLTCFVQSEGSNNPSVSLEYENDRNWFLINGGTWNIYFKRQFVWRIMFPDSISLNIEYHERKSRSSSTGLIIAGRKMGCRHEFFTTQNKRKDHMFWAILQHRTANSSKILRLSPRKLPFSWISWAFTYHSFIGYFLFVEVETQFLVSGPFDIFPATDFRFFFIFFDDCGIAYEEGWERIVNNRTRSVRQSIDSSICQNLSEFSYYYFWHPLSQ